MTSTADLVVVGAGAAGLATAIFAKRAAPQLEVRCVDGAARVGAKILVSGGSRCNVTNRIVTERDFWGGSPRSVRDVLRAFPASRAADFFAELGVPLHEEDDGKLFPDTNKSRTVLDALLREIDSRSIALDAGRRVVSVARDGDRFNVETSEGQCVRANCVVLATGGRSLPKSGSDGFGYELARRLGHGYVDTTPALAPLVCEGDWHSSLSGISMPASLTLRASGQTRVRLSGPLLWTHFGASGPVVLNMSRHWHRAQLETSDLGVAVNVCPGETDDSLDRWLVDQQAIRGRARVSTVLASRLPAAVADTWVTLAGVEETATMAHLDRDVRRRLARTLVDTPLRVTGSRGYTYAEVTAGGIPLDEVATSTMESKVCPGLYLVGEILDVDGRLGGFNFQWAWSSAWVAGQAIARRPV